MKYIFIDSNRALNQTYLTACSRRRLCYCDGDYVATWSTISQRGDRCDSLPKILISKETVTQLTDKGT